MDYFGFSFLLGFPSCRRFRVLVVEGFEFSYSVLSVTDRRLVFNRRKFLRPLMLDLLLLT